MSYLIYSVLLQTTIIMVTKCWCLAQFTINSGRLLFSKWHFFSSNRIWIVNMNCMNDHCFFPKSFLYEIPGKELVNLCKCILLNINLLRCLIFVCRTMYFFSSHLLYLKYKSNNITEQNRMPKQSFLEIYLRDISNFHWK